MKIPQSLTDANLALANSIIGKLHERLKSFPLPDFGRDMLLSDNFCSATAAATVQRSRFISTWFRPVNEANKILRKQCFDNWIEYEDVLKQKRFYSRNVKGDRDVYKGEWWETTSPLAKKHLFQARQRLHEKLCNFKIDLHNCEVDFTPGETSWSSGGHVSVLSKLKLKENWCVTADALDDFCRLVYHNASLKRAAKAHFKTITKKELSTLNFFNDNSGIKVFSIRFKEMVTVAYGSVGDSVPKNIEKRRFINKEPMGNMLLQRLIAGKLLSILNSKHDPVFFNHMPSGQARHRDLIKNELSTIDFSNASDSIHMDLAYFLLPSSIRKLMFKWRSEFVLLNLNIEGEDTVVAYMPEKLCSMGNGFCFETLTLILLSVARTLDPFASVYGDDVIISNEHHAAFTETMESVGFTVNKKKSFTDSKFRESCGAFFYEPVGYISSFDFHWCETQIDFIVNCNKLRIISDNLPPGEFKDLFYATWKSLLFVCPPLLKGPICDAPLESWVQDHKYVSSKTGLKDIREFRLKLIEDTWVAFADYTYLDEMSDVHVVTRHEFTANTLQRVTRNVKCPFILGFYMFNGRATVERIRGNPAALKKSDRRGVWSCKNYFVFPNGHVISVKHMRERTNQCLLAVALLLHVASLNERRRAVVP